ncbi:MAG: Nramp family divalent metal transporter [Candidatus Latescibacterota bacterium]|nr:MAG: Nramp family divalent metal transporter [Candidatus Latescibacterota bacterium]
MVVAATGVGAGDLVAAAKSGATYGLPLLWTALLGALLKFSLAEGIARWQLATGSTILEGWGQFVGAGVRVLFLIYLLIWSFVVAAALMSACGMAAHALVPTLSVEVWAILHAVAALLFVWLREYGGFESAMKWVVGLMFVCILGSAMVQRADAASVLRGLLLPTLPVGGTVLVLGVIGGVGGTLTLLSYNYWMREKGWSGAEWAATVRVDLGIGYMLTGLFGVAVILLGGVVLLPRGIEVAGRGGVLEMAAILGESFGRPGELVFLLGFWGAVASSLLGVWQGVPYLFGDSIEMLRRPGAAAIDARRTRRSPLYRGYLLFMTFPPMLLLLLGRPVWLVVAYAALGSLFMPFLALTLLLLNNRTQMGPLRNGWLANSLLVVCVLLFLYLAGVELHSQLGR